jgi:hypothetical protein
LRRRGRSSKGKSHHRQHLLLLLAAGLASGYQITRAIAHWARLHADSFQQLLASFTRIPSEATLLRTLRQIDSVWLDQVLITSTLSTATDRSGCIVTLQGEILQGQALDGKTVRGASAHGDKTHLLSLVQLANVNPELLICTKIARFLIECGPAKCRRLESVQGMMCDAACAHRSVGDDN